MKHAVNRKRRRIMNYSCTRFAVVFVFLVVAFAAGGPAFAEVRGRTATGHEYVTGGVTVSELRALSKEKNKYTLWITTAAQGSGAHLSDARVKIHDAKKNLVLETTMVGPWLFMSLPPGRYTIEATFKDQTQRETVRVDKGTTRQVLMYFESPAEVSPDWVSPFKDSPYSGTK
ncbi:MAG: hypothetical protein BroJett031_22620 [Betaproteobacteria bacterium]|nr:MAG: hypothetical protein BroJett031_22620 [Betaproteobacteria bacterium]